MSSTKEKIEIPTDHPHIVRVEGVCGGEPIVRGTRVRVADVVGYDRAYHGDLDEVLKDLPSLDTEQVLDALAYYADHADEIEALMAEDEAVNEGPLQSSISLPGPLRSSSPTV